MLCVGLGILVAAFGGHAEGRWQGWKIAGAMASAFLLFLILQETIPKVLPTLRGQLGGTKAFKQVAIWGTGPLFVTQRQNNGDFEFAVFPDDIENSSKLLINVTTFDGKEFTIDCVPPDLLGAHLGELKRMQIALRRTAKDDEWFVYDATNKRFGTFNSSDCVTSPPNASPGKAAALEKSNPILAVFAPAHGSVPDWFSVRKAFAQAQQDSKSNTSDAARKDLTTTLGGLNSEDPNVRIWARTQLSNTSNKDDFKLVVDTWNVGESSYRDDLGRLVAWNTSIKKDPATGTTLLSVLGSDKTDDKIKYVIGLTGYPDLTMRSQATTLVGQLLLASTTKSDQSPAAPATDVTQVQGAKAFWKKYLDTLRTPSPEVPEKGGARFIGTTMTYNNLVALDGVACQITDESRKGEIINTLLSFDTNNDPQSDLSAKSKTLAKKILLNINGGCLVPPR
jgi:hypothetical protein